MTSTGMAAFFYLAPLFVRTWLLRGIGQWQWMGYSLDGRGVRKSWSVYRVGSVAGDGTFI